ncbi:MAG: class I SAM-dependent methyltransferase [Oscillochloris sp.]|nr:class I SAM-dependent methyltransferase [Oscillochloris sp.]
MNTYDPFARYYDADFRDYHDDLPFFREMARRTGGPILELMCGTGRVMLPLVADGFNVTGIDISPTMLELARANLAETDPNDISNRATFIEADVRTVELPSGHFNLIFVAVNSFMHLETVADQLATLSNARRALSRRGLLIVDLFNPDPTAIMREDNRLVFDREYTLDGKHVQKFIAIDSDAAAQLSYVTYLYDETDAAGNLSRRTMRFTMRWLYRYELEHLLARAGFSIRAIYGSYDLDEYHSSSPRLIAVAAPSR